MPLTFSILGALPWLIGLMSFLALMMPGTVMAAEGRLLLTCAEIRQLSPVEADRGLSAVLEAVVTGVPRAPHAGLVVQDATAGLWLDMSKAKARGLWTPACEAALRRMAVGDRVKVLGLTERGGFAPVVMPSGLDILSSGAPLPEALDVTVSEVLTGKHDVRRVRIKGVVQETGVDGLNVPNYQFLKLVSEGGFVLLRAPSAALPPERELLNTQLEVSGTIISQHNSRAEIVGAVLVTDRVDDVKVLLRSPPADQAPLLSLASLRPYEYSGATDFRRRIIGRVTYWQPGQRLVLQDGSAAVEVTTRHTDPIALGSLVEASGFVSPPRPLCRIENAALRVLQPGASPAPAKITLTELLEASLRKHTNNWQRSVFDYHYRLVTLKGSLVEAFGDVDQRGRTLLLRSDGLPIPVRWDGAPTGFGEAWQPGTELAVTGIVRIDPVSPGTSHYEPSGQGDVTLLLRSEQDVQVLTAASWWTRPRLLNAAWAGLALIALALFTVAKLSRRVRRQAQELAGRIALQKEAEIRFDATLAERNRLGADMHDGLQQFIAGLSMQLEVAQGSLELGRDATPALKTARSLLLTLRGEFRHCLNALHATEAEMDIPVILERTSAIIRACHPVNIREEVLGEPFTLPGNVVANLMLITQEAATNAVRHGKARQIVLRCHFSSEAVKVEVQDDGIGFDVAAVSADGHHYGLPSMEERMRRLGGTLTVDSRPGKGTLIAAQLSLPLQEIPLDTQSS